MTRWALAPLLGLAALAPGCAGLPEGAYFPAPGAPNTLRVANVLYRAAVAAGDDPARYSFALIKTRHPVAFTDEDATFYISDGLAQMSTPVLEADQRAVEILRAMGNPTPRRSLADALRAVDAAPVRSQDGDGGALDTRPTLQDRLGALEPVEPVPMADAAKR